jgi:hypothetical protein
MLLITVSGFRNLEDAVYEHAIHFQKALANFADVLE